MEALCSRRSSREVGGGQIKGIWGPVQVLESSLQGSGVLLKDHPGVLRRVD